MGQHFSGPPFVWTVELHYGRLPGHQRTDQRIEVFTIDSNYSPILAAKVDKIGQVPKTHYRSQRDVPLLTEAAGSIVIEHFMLPQGPVEATVLYKSQTPMRGRLLGTQAHEALPSSSPHPSGVPGRPVESPAWSFTLRAPEMWVEGNVYGGTQSEMFDVLAQIDAISGRPGLLARYQKELSAWEHLSGR